MDGDIKNLGKLSYPQDFIQFYFNELKKKLNLNDVLLARTGFIGYFLEMMGNMQFDIKSYYDYLFKESFPITAEEDRNLLYHSNVYGFKPYLAQEASVRGNIKFQIDSLPMPAKTVNRREVYFRNVSINVGGIVFQLDSLYKMEIYRLDYTNFNYIVEISNVDYKRKIPITKSNPIAPIFNMNQYVIDEEIFNVDFYPYGSHYSHLINNTTYVSRLKASVRPFDSTEWTEFHCEPSKSFYDGNENVIFYTILPNNNINIELGNGNNGKHIPSSEIKIQIYQCVGESGNINYQNVGCNGTATVIDYDAKGKLIYAAPNMLSAGSIMEFQIEKCEGGMNPLLGKKLRDDLIKFIQTRTNLLSEQDFSNLIKRYFPESETLFKKTEFSVNSFFTYVTVRNRIDEPIKALTVTIPLGEFEKNKIFNSQTKDYYVYEPDYEIGGHTYLCPFLFRYNTVIRLWEGYAVDYAPIFYAYEIDKIIDISYPVIFIQLEFKKYYTRIWAKSYNDLSEMQIKLTVQNLSISANMTLQDDAFYYDYMGGGLFDREFMTLEVWNLYEDNLVHCWTYHYQGVFQMYDISDILKLRAYRKLDEQYYIINFPLLNKDMYITDRVWYNNEMINDLVKFELKENRCISDDVELRFLNTAYVDRKTLAVITLQKYDFDIQLPFKLKIDLILKKDVIVYEKLIIDDELLKLKYEISKYLLANQTGTKLKFYKSKISDIAHNFNWVKSCFTTVYDYDDYEIPYGNIEAYSVGEIAYLMEKEDFLDFCPIYFHWDLNNMMIDYKLDREIAQDGSYL